MLFGTSSPAMKREVPMPTAGCSATDGPEFKRVAVVEHYAMRSALGPGKARTSLARKGPCAFVHRTSART